MEFFAWYTTDSIPRLGETIMISTQPYKVVGLIYETRPVQLPGILKHVAEYIEDGVHVLVERVQK